MKTLAQRSLRQRTFDFVEEELPALGANDVLVRMDAVGLCHSDLPRYTGRATIAVSSRGYRESIPVTFPCMVGHEPVGTVVDIGSAVTRFAVGDHVTGHMPTCFRTHLVIREDAMIFKYPEKIAHGLSLLRCRAAWRIVNILNMATQQSRVKRPLLDADTWGCW